MASNMNDLQDEIIKLQNEEERNQMMSDRQINAIGLINTDREEKDEVIDELLDKRLDVQNEYAYMVKALNSILAEKEELKAEVKCLKEQEEERHRYLEEQAKDYSNSNISELDSQYQKAFEQKEKAHGHSHGQPGRVKLTLDQQVSNKIGETTEILNSQEKQLELEILSRKFFVKHVKTKVRYIKPSFHQILKRINKYWSLQEEENINKPFCRAILVKVFTKYCQQSTQEDELESNFDDHEEQNDGGTSRRLLQSERSAKSAKSSKKTILTPEEQAQKLAKDKKNLIFKQQQDDPTHKNFKYKCYQETFRISKHTTLDDFKKKICSHWGLNFSNYSFYDENSDSLAGGSDGNQGASNDSKIEKVMDSLSKKEVRLENKELTPPGQKKVMLYLGDKNFSNDFIQMRELIIKRKKYNRALLKAKNKLQEMDEDSSIKMDNEYKILSKFPGVKQMYLENREILEANEAKPKMGFDLRYGEWMPPSCCSMFINLLQFLLTFYSLVLQKGHSQSFWLPQLVRQDLEPSFNAISNFNQFWDFTENKLGHYLFYDQTVVNQYEEIDYSILNTWVNETHSDLSKGKFFIGPVRFLMKRVKRKDCKRSSTIQRYQKYFADCYEQRYNEENADKESYSPEEWGNYWYEDHRQHEKSTSLTGEYITGQFGRYYTSEGFKYDFDPYDVNYEQFKEQAEEMRRDGFVTKGPTKAFTIAFTHMYPSSSYMVTVLLTFEFTNLGQVIPSRFDAQTYRMSAFAPAQTGIVSVVDTFKYLFVLQTIYVIVINLSQNQTFFQLFRWKNFENNIFDIIIVFTQGYGLMLKIRDATDFNFNSEFVLDESYRETYRPMLAASYTFKKYSSVETISLIFVLFRLVDGLRVLINLNMVIKTLMESIKTLSYFLLIWFLFFYAMTPYAQALWGHRFVGYKTFKDAHLSVMMISFCKGNLNELINLNSPHIIVFMLLYYSIAVFMMNGAAVFIQKNALKRMVLCYGMDNGSILDSTKPSIVLDKKAALKAKQTASVTFSVRIISWTFGWMPRSAINSFQRFMTDHLMPEDSDHDDEEQIQG